MSIGSQIRQNGIHEKSSARESAVHCNSISGSGRIIVASMDC